MWSVISGILKRELPQWLLASSETWNEAFLDLKKKNNLMPQLQGRDAAGQREDRQDGNIRNMNHILISHRPLNIKKP